MKRLRLLGAVCALILAGLTLNAHAALVVPAGLNPGDAYHVIFVTSGTIDAISSDITTYDAFVQATADAASIGSSIGMDWLALGSTSSVSAFDHLAPLFTDPFAPIYNQNGELLAADVNGLWNGQLENAVLYDEDGFASPGTVWTGTDPGGMAVPGFELGFTAARPVFGNATGTSQDWVQGGNGSGAFARRMYAVSSLITVPGVPLPPALWLFGSGLLGLFGVARQRTARA